ncbi:hypothetical protein EFR84_31790 [Rhizobium chutanense]|uniref:Uncharacterized protein n=1 Tax=Rhizobium chutanense TaxID=2035448 RepID=A0A3S0SN09_9HYPH|nr:hypothetical protein EFR84_31790 [Rhizobium chutanense]
MQRGGISAGPRKQSAFPVTIREFDRASFPSMRMPGFPPGTRHELGKPSAALPPAAIDRGDRV